ncbi:N-acetylmuramoyl-L-alanine amidase [Rickettsiales bacterium LUAb2]
MLNKISLMVFMVCAILGVQALSINKAFAEVSATEITDFSSLNPIDIKNDPIMNLNSSDNKAAASSSKNTTPGEVIDIQATSKDDVTRIIFDVSKDFSTEVKIVNFPFRLMFDLPTPYVWKVDNSSLDNPDLDKVMRSLRYGYPNANVFRVIADLKVPVNVDRAFLVPYNNNYRFVIDLKPANVLTTLLNSSTLVVPSTEASYVNLAQINTKDQVAINDQKRNIAVNKWVDSYLSSVNYPLPVVEGNPNSKVVIVIDPGHGGKDPGAMPSPDSPINEKTIVLQIAKLIKEDLLKNQEVQVILTRRGDYFVPLKDRILWAKKYNADLFVSIHADRAVSNDSSGMSVYTLSEKASDAQTQVIATDQNKSDIIAGFNIGEEDTQVSRILISLLQRVKVNDSVTLAKDVLSSASTNVNLLFNPLRSAGFVVLQVPETPSILIETGFLSNDGDVNKLTNPQYQAIIAQKITEGIEQYLWDSKKLKLMPAFIKLDEKVAPTTVNNTTAPTNNNSNVANPSVNNLTTTNK